MNNNLNMDNKNYNNENEDFNEEYNESNQNSENDDDFGLSEAAYDPIDRDDNSNQVHTETESRYAATYQEEEKSNSGLIVTLVVLLFFLAGGASYFFFFNDEPQPEPIVKAEIKVEPVEEEVEPTWEEPVEEEPVETKPVVGTITHLSERTGRSHVIIGSFFDQDNILDYSNKLTKEGVNCKIIPPTGKSHYYRLSVQDFATFSEAMAHAEELKGKFSSEVWVLKY